MTRVALYLRISQDPKQTELGIERQREDCRGLCERNGWQVVVEHVDNHRSAFKDTVKRPGYAALLDDIRARRIDKVVVWKSDRLTRTLRASIDLFDLLLANDVTVHAVSGGDTDLTTSSGIAMAQMAAVMSENYVRTSRENNLRMRRQIAEKGGRHKVSRVYGWEEDGIKVRESEAEVVREMIDRIISGETPTSIAADLNDRHVPTIRSSIWHGITVKKMATRASNAAIREHRGELHYNGQWEPIVSVEMWERVNLAISNGQQLRYKRGPGRKYLLTGFVYCGNCGSKLSGAMGAKGTKPIYRCMSYRSNDRSDRGCGKVSRHVAPLEDLISEAVLLRLSGPQMAKAVDERRDDRTAVTELLRKRDDQQARIDNLIDTFYTGRSVLTEQQFNRAKTAAQDELDLINKQLAATTAHDALASIDLTGSLHTLWTTASLSWKRNIIELLVERVEVSAYAKNASVVKYKSWRFDPHLITIHWRV